MILSSFNFEVLNIITASYKEFPAVAQA